MFVCAGIAHVGPDSHAAFAAAMTWEDHYGTTGTRNDPSTPGG